MPAVTVLPAVTKGGGKEEEEEEKKEEEALFLTRWDCRDQHDVAQITIAESGEASIRGRRQLTHAAAGLEHPFLATMQAASRSRLRSGLSQGLGFRARHTQPHLSQFPSLATNQQVFSCVYLP